MFKDIRGTNKNQTLIVCGKRDAGKKVNNSLAIASYGQL